MTKDKWETPLCWLLDFLAREDTDLLAEAQTLAGQLETPEIEGMYLDEMLKDGYFDREYVFTYRQEFRIWVTASCLAEATRKVRYGLWDHVDYIAECGLYNEYLELEEEE